MLSHQNIFNEVEKFRQVYKIKLNIMLYNKIVGDEIFNRHTTHHPQSFKATFGKNLKEMTISELNEIVDYY